MASLFIKNGISPAGLMDIGGGQGKDGRDYTDELGNIVFNPEGKAKALYRNNEIATVNQLYLPENEDVLNKLSENDSEELLYNGKAISGKSDMIPLTPENMDEDPTFDKTNYRDVIEFVSGKGVTEQNFDKLFDENLTQELDWSSSGTEVVVNIKKDIKNLTVYQKRYSTGSGSEIKRSKSSRIDLYSCDISGENRVLVCQGETFNYETGEKYISTPNEVIKAGYYVLKREGYTLYNGYYCYPTEFNLEVCPDVNNKYVDYYLYKEIYDKNKSVLSNLDENQEGMLTYKGSEISGNVDISLEDGNIIQEKDDGLYAKVGISSYPNNIIVKKDDGLYATTEGGGGGSSTTIIRDPKNTWLQILTSNRTTNATVANVSYANTKQDYEFFLVFAFTSGSNTNTYRPTTNNYTCQADNSTLIYSSGQFSSIVSGVGYVATIEIYRVNKNGSITASIKSDKTNYNSNNIAVYRINNFNDMSNVELVAYSDNTNTASKTINYNNTKDCFLLSLACAASYSATENIVGVASANGENDDYYSTTTSIGNSAFYVGLNKVYTNTTPSFTWNGTATSYAVTGGFMLSFDGSVVNSVETYGVYSTDETLIGEWLGQPLYRKIIDLNYSSLSETFEAFSLSEPINVNTLVYTRGIGFRDDAHTQPMSADVFAYFTNSNTIYVSSNSNIIAKHLVLEYTKN